MNRKITDWVFLGICVLFLGFRVYQTAIEWQKARNTTPIYPSAPIAHQQSTEKKPTSDYKKHRMQGFQVFIDAKSLAKPTRAKRLTSRLDSILKEIAQVTTPPQLAALRKTKIWLSSEELVSIEAVPGTFDISGQNRHFTAHKAAGWYISGDAESLKSYAKNPDKAKSIEIGDIPKFMQYSKTVQTAIVLHELAHAYHDQVLGEENPQVQAAYNQAIAEKLYTMIDLTSGKDSQAYAATNAQEYFAELSVAYLARNDDFPYTHSNLQEIDPVGYRLMQKIWGPRDSRNQVPN